MSAEQPNPEALEDVKDVENQAVPETTQPPPPAETAATTTTAAAAAETEIKRLITVMDHDSLNIILAFFALVSMISATQTALPTTPSSMREYEIACGATSFGIAFLTAVASYFGFLSMGLAYQVIAGFQFLWWVAGVIVLTFFGSFQMTVYANGYFGTWFAFLFATLLFMSVSPQFEHHVNKQVHSPRKPLWFLCVASAVVMGASIAPCSPQSVCYSYRAWAVSMSTISLFLALVMFFLTPKIPENKMVWMAKFLVLWWAVGTLVVTFGGPFETTGNGYFFSYGAFVASISVLSTCLKA